MEEEPRSINESKTKIFLRFLKFGLLAWGGPVAQIAMIRQELVEKEKWVSKEKFNRALSIYQALPGPEAHELCVYFGMIAGGRMGGFLAGLGFMLPGFIFILLLTWLYVNIGIGIPLVQAAVIGIHAAVIALIFTAVYRIGKHAIINKKLLIISFVSAIVCASGVSFYIILPSAGIVYYFWMTNKITVAVAILFLLVILSAYQFTTNYQSPKSISTNITGAKKELYTTLPQIFFSGLKGGLLTFGGAYTVIPFIQEDAVIKHSWLTNKQFLDGLALTGILPAPLIIFTTFVGYFGGGWLGAVIITIGIFLPAFCFTLAGHQIIEKIIENKSLHNFLDGLTAGVIGLIAVTAIQLFADTINDVFSLILFAAMLLFLLKFKSKYAVIYVILISGTTGLIYHLSS